MTVTYQPSAPPESREGSVQNFIIVMPNAGPITDMGDLAQAQGVLHAIRTALGGATAPKAPCAVRGATLEEVAHEWFRNNLTSWAPSYSGRLKHRLETGLLEHIGT